jgi:UDP-N-acetylglucosamine 3-dehydrogenase
MSADRSAPIAFAFLGCGEITHRHSTLLRAFPGVTRFHASRDAARAAATNAALGGAGAFGTYEAALGDPRVTCAVVATPPSTHLPLTLAALRAGKDVVVEKPAFLASDDVDTVRDLAATAQRLVLVAENYHYKPLATLLRQTVLSGQLGDVRFILVNALKRQASTDWRDDPAVAGGGALYEGGVHWVHFMANLGLTVTGVHGWRPGATSSNDPERSTLALFEYAEGAVGTLAHSWEISTPFGGLALSGIYGTAGSVHFESNGLGVVLRAGATRVHFPGMRDVRGFGTMWRDFVAALRARREPQMTLAHARRDLELIEHAAAPPLPR